MYAAVSPFLQTAWAVKDAPLPPWSWFLVVASTLANVVVIAYHYTVPPHPKFLMVRWRAAVLRTHIVSGTTELLAGLFALIAEERELAAQVMAIAALGFHVPTAFAQTPIVFGARAIMRPAYLLCIGLHAFSAIQLLRHPSSLYWTGATFLVFNIYVWCRIYYFIFDKIGLFRGDRYSITIILAGLTTAPVLLGLSSVLVIVVGCGLYMILYWLFFLRKGDGWSDFVREAARDSAIPDDVRALWKRPAQEPQEQAARNLFDLLDEDHDGFLEGGAVATLLKESKLPAAAVERYLGEQEGGLLDYPGFLERVWSLDAVRAHGLALVALQGAASERDKAELVFRHLDLDGDGVLGPGELDLLLRGWSLPSSELDRWLEVLGPQRDSSIDFPTFLGKLGPVWKFIYYDVVEAEHGTRVDMIQRGITLRRHESSALRIRNTLERELAEKLEFLQGASPEALDEFAASLLEDEASKGCVLFREGDSGDSFFLIRSGRVSVTRAGETLATLEMGDYLGEGSLLSDTPRSATAHALTDCRLLRMTQASFQYLMERQRSLREALHQIHEERRVFAMQRVMQQELLGKLPLLMTAAEPVKEALLHALVDHGRQICQQGEVVFEEGAPGDALYLISSGAVRISRGGEAVAELGPGNFFGEGAMLSGERRTASATATVDSVLYRLARTSLEPLLASAPAFAGAVREAHEARQRSRRIELLRRAPWATQLSAGRLEALQGSFQRTHIDAGDVLFREGDPSDILYVVAQGTVSVEREGLRLAELGDGAWFDLHTVLQGRPRAATIIAKRDAELWGLSRADLVDALRDALPTTAPESV